jgi:uncharacterized membrane protein YccF (DUF307 family)
MSLLGNIIWVIFGGFFVFLGYIIGGIAMCLTIIGIPFGFQCFKLAIFALLPFGQDTRMVNGDMSGLSLIFNIIWLLIGGWFVFLNHLFWGILLSITIIGLPFGLQHFKLMKLAFIPFGREIIDTP